MIPQIYASTLWGKNWIEVIPNTTKKPINNLLWYVIQYVLVHCKFICFSDRISIRILEEFCYYLQNTYQRCWKTSDNYSGNWCFQLLRSEFWRWFQNSLRIPPGNLIGIPLEKTVESSFYSIMFVLTINWNKFISCLIKNPDFRCILRYF